MHGTNSHILERLMHKAGIYACCCCRIGMRMQHSIRMQVREGLHYNPYFPGGAIAMPKMLVDEGTEYEDETVATEAQQAKVIPHHIVYQHRRTFPPFFLLRASLEQCC